jgi:PhoPQ-activated pathogenicity-related protein
MQRKSRTEDAIVAMSFRSYLNDRSMPEWVVYNAMVKSAVAAMNTIQTYAATDLGHVVSSFVVAGASKRGWTTWLTSGVDSRVIGSVPIVLDFLNFLPNMRHMYRAYGGWTFAFKDYYDENFTLSLGTDPEGMQALMDIVDPIEFVANVSHVVCGLWSVVCGMWYGGYGLWSVVCGLWSVVCGLWSVVCGI